MRRRVEATASRTPWLACTDGDAVTGYAYATRHRERAAYRWSVEVSVYLHESARGRGVGAGAYQALLTILRIQGFHRAFAGITLPNPASVRLHENAGFTPLGVFRRVGFKCGAWHDVGWWERGLAEPAQPPEEPLPFEQIAESARVVAALAEGAARIR
jgi:phosphinothricin acetyltransferase